MKAKIPNFVNLLTRPAGCGSGKLSGNFSMLALLLLIGFSVMFSPLAALAQGSGPSADLDQIRNGGKTSPINPPNWVNGNANATQAHYLEGHSIAYRMVMNNLGTDPNVIHELVIGYDHLKTAKGLTKHALDFITYYRNIDPHHTTDGGPFDHYAENIKPLRGITGVTGDSVMMRVAAPTTELNAAALATFNGLYNANIDLDRAKFVMYGGGAGAEILSMDINSYSFSGEETRLTIRFKSSNNKVVLLWGGHIATSTDWGAGMSAVAIDGSPYHTRLISIDGKGGNQDRSLQAAAVTPLDPPTCDVNGDEIICSDGTGTYAAISDGTQSGYSWEFTDIVLKIGGSVNPSFLTPSAGATVSGATADVVTVDPGDALSFKVKVTISKTGAASTSCDMAVQVEYVTAVAAKDGDLTCDDGTVRVSASLNGSLTIETPTYAWMLNGSPIPNSNVSFLDVIVAGTYSVTISSNSTADGCEATDEIEVFDLTDEPEITITPLGEITCDPASYTTLTATLDNVPSYIDPLMISYAWIKVGDPTVLSTTNTYQATEAGTYRVTVEFDETGCTAFEEEIVTEDKTPPTVDANGPYSVLCEASSVAISGTSDGTSFMWTVSPLGAGNFGDATMLSTTFSFNIGYTSATLRLTAYGDNDCEAYDEAAVTQEPCVGPKHCTLTQGGYGNANGKFCGDPMQRKRSVLIADLLTAYGPVTVGIQGIGSNSLSLGTSACIIEKLPAGGPAIVLPNGVYDCSNFPASILDKKSKKFNNVLIGQVVALTLNLRLDAYLFDNTLQDVELTHEMTTAAATSCDDEAEVVPSTEMTWMIPLSVLDYFSNNSIDPTIGNLLQLANQGLSGNIPGIGAKPSLSHINAAVSAVNEMFNECRILVTAPVNGTARLAGSSPVTDNRSLKAYPNPFSEVTTVEFSVTENQAYSLDVFDVTGRKVASLGAGNAEAGKVYTYKVGDARLPEGMYVVKLNTGTYVETLRIILKR